MALVAFPKAEHHSTADGRRSATCRFDICEGREIKIPSLSPSSVPRHHSSQTPREIHDSIIPPCPAPGVGDDVFDAGTEGEGGDDAGMAIRDVMTVGSNIAA
ncbi:hypothetical protein FIBSPDRAFT_239598 [Athelia psychrophila]|uniref:Uncharacterized protein n=1 Tax=Athelia psychrophila TaxID=1759441 RepID=A0A165YCN1_9AGAM|nr:hypothetical protein FIBSPDRAFT_239598 [Fibularhizoctonia sp. CBS 109695]